jgi:hypothetical protein
MAGSEKLWDMGYKYPLIYILPMSGFCKLLSRIRLGIFADDPTTTINHSLVLSSKHTVGGCIFSRLQIEIYIKLKFTFKWDVQHWGFGSLL